MAGHTSEKRWDRNKFGDSGLGDQVRDSASAVMHQLNLAEDVYQDLLELWVFAGGTDQSVADQLFFDIWSVREPDPILDPGVFDTEANSVEVAMVTDAKAAILSLHQLFGAMTNVAVSQADRISTMRRMT